MVTAMLSGNNSLVDAASRPAYRPRISRETRRLLTTALVAVLTLWVLARMRFPDRPPTPNPVPPILEQLTAPPTFADLADRIADARTRLADSLLSVAVVDDADASENHAAAVRVPALRIRDDLAVTILASPASDALGAPSGVVGEDRASGLALIETPTTLRPVLPILWSPRDLDRPRYLFASSPSAGEISLRPAFVDSLRPVVVPQWSGAVWAVPADGVLAPGSVVFTEDGELVGLVAPHDAGLAVVPARTVLAAAERLLETPRRIPADPGIEVDALTPPLAAAAGVERGVVVTWVDPEGVATSQLRAGDVIEAANDVAIISPEQWRVLAARASVGDVLELRVTRRGTQHVVSLAMPAPAVDAAAMLGLTLRSATRAGSEVTRVQRGSAAGSAGLVAGDLITAIGDVTAPTPRQVRAAFAAMERGNALMVAITHAGSHRVVAIQK